MSLRLMQSEFALMVADLITWVYRHDGWELTFGEAYRTPEQAAWDASHGTGIANSLHRQRLAIDLNLFVGGVYRTESDAYLPLGEYWESKGGSWGGRFSQPDGNHFSLSPDGGKTR